MKRLEELIREYERLGIRDQIDYDKFYLYSIITHSTAIEGSTVTEVENQLMFDKGISPGKPVAEQLMNLDLKEAYEAAFALAGSHTDYSIDLLCSLSARVMKNTGSLYNTISGSFDSSAGELRLINVSAGCGGRSYMAWQKVPARLQGFCSWLNEERSKIDKDNISEVYRLSFEAHYKLVTIHPWADGNGRMSRLVMNMLQHELDAVPSVVKKESRAEYIQSLQDTRDREDVGIFIDFMMNHHANNIEEQIMDYKRSIENDTLNDTLNLKNDTLNRYNELTEKERTVLQIISNDNSVTISRIMELTGYSRPTVTRTLDTLKDKGCIERSGSKKSGHWVAICDR